jgi:hypothetical protein
MSATVNASPLADRYFWRIQLLDSYQIVAEKKWNPGQGFVLLYGTRGGSYRIGLEGYPKSPEKQQCRSEPIPITAKPALKTIHLTIPNSCQ